MNIAVTSSVYQKGIAWTIVVKSNVNLIAIVSFAKITKNVRKKGTPMNKTCADCIHYGVCAKYNKVYERELSERYCAECDFFKDKSRFIELPCAVGDSCYPLAYGGSQIVERKISRIIVSARNIMVGYYENDGQYRPPLRTRIWGKEVFATKEEWEQHWKGGAE